jgi:hypothetical protein
MSFGSAMTLLGAAGFAAATDYSCFTNMMDHFDSATDSFATVAGYFGSHDAGRQANHGGRQTSQATACVFCSTLA